MSEATELTPAVRKFVLHWGELGTRWGLNRTVAQIHALLYVSPRPLPAEHIVRLLEVARSNVSVSLRELQAWGVIRVVHVLGDRRDHFEATKDVWEMFATIVEGRKRREIDPTLAVLRECSLEMERAGTEPYARARLADMLSFFESFNALYEELRRLPAGTLRQLVKLRSKFRALLTSEARGDGAALQ